MRGWHPEFGVEQKLKTTHLVALLSIITIIVSSQSVHRFNVSAMRILVQRVKSASVTVEGQMISSIGPGLVALVGLHEDDTIEDLQYCCKRLLLCKLWNNDNGQAWRQSVKQRNYDCLCVSQFTLYGKVTKKSPSPDYKSSMKSMPAQVLYEQFLGMMKQEYHPNKIHDGQFGAMMDVTLVNDGPVTILIESSDGVTKSSSTNNQRNNDNHETATQNDNRNESSTDP
jgi:D-aminoacyl-tRNA deacylase